MVPKLNQLHTDSKLEECYGKTLFETMWQKAMCDLKDMISCGFLHPPFFYIQILLYSYIGMKVLLARPLLYLDPLPSFLQSKKRKTQPLILRGCLARKKIKTKSIGKAEQSSVYFLLKMYKCSQEFLPRFRDITKRDILKHTQRDIFNPSIRYPKYLENIFS